MATKVGGKAPRVTKGPTRAAKGAGAGKNTRAPSVVKEQPYSSASLGSAGVGHNSGDALEMERKLKEARQAQLLSLRKRHRDVDGQLDTLREAAKELNGTRKEIRSAIEGVGYSLEEYDRAEKDAGSTRIDLDKKERQRAEIREVFGLPQGVQDNLFTAPNGRTVPDAARGAIYWRAEGYRIGLGAPLKLIIPQGCPPENHQDFLGGADDAQKRIQDAYLAVEAAKSDAPKAQAGTGGGEPATLEQEKGRISLLTDEELVAELEAQDAPTEGGRDEREAWLLESLGHEPVEETPEQERNRLKAEEATAKAGLAAIGTQGVGEITDPDPLGVGAEAQGLAEAGDGFEATPEELGAQIDRRVIQEQRAGETPDPVI